MPSPRLPRSALLPTRRSLAAALTCALLAASLTAGLHAPLLAHLDTHVILGRFHAGHVWGFDHAAALLTGEAPWTVTSTRLAFPDRPAVALVGWVPASLVTPVNMVFGPLASYNMALLVTPVLSALAAWWGLRRLLGLGAWTAVGPALLWGLSPVALGFLANGQLPKAQLWGLVLPLVAVSGACRGGWAWLAMVPLFCAATAVTSPSLALQLPFVLGLLVIAEVIGASGRRLPATLAGGLSLGLAAAGMAAFRSYYGTLRGGSHPSAFEPAVPARPGQIMDPNLSAELWPTLVMPDTLSTVADEVHHLTWIGPVLLLAGLAGMVAGRRGRTLAAGVFFVCLTLALGPRLTADGVTVTLGSGAHIGLPAQLLVDLGYPLAESGAWYRLAAGATLGAVLGVGALLTRLPARAAVAVSALLAVAQVSHTIWVTQAFWPRGAAAVPGAAELARWESHEALGAVLDLPLDTDLAGNHRSLLAATLHGRSTTAWSRPTPLKRFDELAAFDEIRLRAEASSPAEARALIRGQGFTAVTYRAANERPWLKGHTEPQVAALTAVLGQPVVDGEVWLWWLD